MTPAPPVKVTLTRRESDLKQILKLQAANLREAVGEDTAREQGFVTAKHDLPLLRAMTEAAASVIARQGRRVVGYALAMTRAFGDSVPVLRELFERQDVCTYGGQRLGEVNYLVMGQVCVAEEARGKRLVDRMYKYMRGCYALHYPYLITAIVASNTRSRRVHERIGFEVLQEFTGRDGREWILVIWDWRE